MEEGSSFIVFGTPLEPLDSDELPSKKPVQLQDQKVYDENGLQRFHGAFTGGFSAGYFNTVGTKEGWTPSVFVSSRSQKADKNRQRPEDFMDADDMREYGIAPARVQTTERFRKDVPGAPQPKVKGPEIIPGVSPLADIIRTKSESMGFILLRKLGWRPGQGIGPRKKAASHLKVFGCALPPGVSRDNQGSDGETSDHEIASNYTFAPRDIKVLPYKPKDNVQGLGYVPLDRTQFSVSSMLAESISGHVGTGSGKKKVAFRGQAFGVGAFENDDEDIYVRDDLSRYDFVLGGDPSDDRVKPVDRNKGRPGPLEDSGLKGFVPASKTADLNKKHFPPPDLPPGFKPKSFQSAPVNIVPTSNETIPKTKVGSGRFLNRFAYTAVDRTKMMQNRFSDTKTQPSSEQPALVETKEADASVQSQPMPPIADSDKDRDVKLPPLRFPTVLSTKFVSSTILDEEETTYGLIKPSSVLVQPSSKTEVKDEVTPEHKCQRLIEEWHPIALLCKRFNVPDPFPQSTTVGTLKSMSTRPSAQKVSIFRSLFEIPVPDVEPKQERSEPDVEKAKEQEHSEDTVNDGAETTEWERSSQRPVVEPQLEEDFRPPTPPTLDLFKAIFQDSSSEEGSEESETESGKEAEAKNEEPSRISIQHPAEITSAVELLFTPAPPPAETAFYGPSLPPAGVETARPSPGLGSIKKPHKAHKRKSSHHKKHKKESRKHKKKKKSKQAPSDESDSVVEISDSPSDDEVDIKLIKRLKQMKKSKHR